MADWNSLERHVNEDAANAYNELVDRLGEMAASGYHGEKSYTPFVLGMWDIDVEFQALIWLKNTELMLRYDEENVWGHLQNLMPKKIKSIKARARIILRKWVSAQ